MLNMQRYAAIFSMIFLLAGCAGQQRLLEGNIAIDDVNGLQHSPLEQTGQAATVLIFITHDCPISNGYAPELNSIASEYAGRGVNFYAVHVDLAVTLEQARTHAEQYGYRFPVLLDLQHRLVSTVQATVTPEAAVLDAKNTLVYRGCIDDRYVDFGKKRAAPSQRDLREALEAILNGRPVTNSRTKAVGCFIGASS